MYLFTQITQNLRYLSTSRANTSNGSSTSLNKKLIQSFHALTSTFPRERQTVAPQYGSYIIETRHELEYISKYHMLFYRVNK